jgi:predicted flap endonuclease-1-like 5' DNA nuclease
MLQCSTALSDGAFLMPSSTTTRQTLLFTPYARSADATQAVMAFWRDMMSTSAEMTLWWTRKWLEAPRAFLAWSPFMYMPARSATVVELKRPASVIDLAEAAAARAAAEVSDIAAEVVEIAETAFEAPVEIAEDAVSVATAAVEAVEAVEAAAPVALALTPDDLTRLVGIGPKLAAALAERGVTRFAQLAAWTAVDLAEVDKALDLKGRAVRDAWVAQAKRFAAETSEA